MQHRVKEQAGESQVNDDLIFKTLMEINTNLGRLAESAETRRAQVVALVSEVKEMRGEMSDIRVDLRAHAAEEASIATKVEAIEEDIRDNIKPVTAILSNAKAKGLAVLAFIALMGGSVGGQAEKILSMFLGKAP
jgi:regulator of replication initiation timing